jgi:hypothetical protein
LERYEYGNAYWVAPAATTGLQRFFGCLQSENGETLEEYAWQLPFMNQFGREGWVIWRDWQVDTQPGHWVLKRVMQTFSFDGPFQLTVACVRRTA